ncbi:MAG: ATP synthase subunit a [candidate division TM6 bacterium GW2011_GWE2_41_16]|nr:MAG: ATP synthase subunit a [candidate division TM6 bacterium GW2011_GWE2_41_16]
MKDIEIFHEHFWKPFTTFGLNQKFLYLSADTLIFTWVVLGVIIVLSILARIAIKKPNSIAGHAVLQLVGAAVSMAQQALGIFSEKYSIYVAILFGYIFLCNTVVLLPFCEEPTKDINTTLALALLSFFYIQKETFLAKGLIDYLQVYFMWPFAVRSHKITLLNFPWLIIKIILNTVIGFIGLPLEILSKFASVISLAFRLFGNIFGGAIITDLWKNVLVVHPAIQVIGIVSGINLIIAFFFGFFEGFIQAFVFSTLSITYLGISLGEGH